jgi:drug/metabolite transporter (DMT)-like permease
MNEIIRNNLWIILVVLYGLLKGVRDVLKKKALEKNTVMEVLFGYTLIAFIFVLPETGSAIKLKGIYILLICLKSALVFSAWICSFNAIKRLPISFFGVLDLSGVLFSTALGVIFLSEVLHINQIVGLVIVTLGLFAVNYQKKSVGESISPKFAALALISCLLNASSGVMDKFLMQTGEITSGQLQFWFMFIMVILYIAYILISRTKINFKSIIKNYSIIIMSILFVIGDRALFIANSQNGYMVSTATLIKQCACIITILGGKLVFKEKNTAFRLLCAAVILVGIGIACR